MATKKKTKTVLSQANPQRVPRLDKLKVDGPNNGEAAVAEITKALNNRMEAGVLGYCPVEFTKDSAITLSLLRRKTLLIVVQWK